VPPLGACGCCALDVAGGVVVVVDVVGGGFGGGVWLCARLAATPTVSTATREAAAVLRLIVCV
jgi:hypothetical protein